MNEPHTFDLGLERDWKLALLAFQSDFIDTQQLLRSIELWAAGSESSPLDILTARGDLDRRDLQLLIAMRCHGGPSVSETGTPCVLQCEETKPAHPDSGSGRPANWLAGEVGRFEIEKLIATGGLGNVCVAYDRQLNRRVAYKELRAQHSDDLLNQARFLQEAEITSRLEHPAIVPVYSVGLKADGSPFYAMRLVEGQTWKQAVEQLHTKSSADFDYHSVEFRRLISQLIEVCRAIEFAHQHQIVHRDIKPANIVLGPQGEAVVVDWGLAKALGKNSFPTPESCDMPSDLDSAPNLELTEAGTIVGTPAYMSPEQADPQSGPLDPRSDQFSLGATLYFLLAGVPPYQGKHTADLIRLARECRFNRPTRLRSKIPLALEAICMKAMSRRPSERFFNVAALANDLENWLADQPITAYRDSTWERSWRFVRKNRRLTAVAGLSLVAIAAITSVLTVLLNWKSNEAELARQSASRQAETNAKLAAQEHQARTAANRATNLTLDTMRTVVFQIQRKLSKVPQAQTPRREMLESTLKGLNQIGDEFAAQNYKDRATLTAHNDLGMIYLLAGSEQTGATQTAADHFKIAIEIGLALFDQSPESYQACLDLSIAYEYLGDAELEMGHWDQAAEAFQKGLNVSAKFAEQNPTHVEVQRDLGFGWEKVGDVRLKRGEVLSATEAFLQSKHYFESALATQPSNLICQRDVCVSLQKIGNLQLEHSDWASAEATFRDCLERIRKSNSQSNQVFQPRDEIVLSNKLGLAIQGSGQLDRCRTAFETGLQIARELAQNNNSRQTQRDLALSLGHVGRIAVLQGKLSEAEPLLLQSQEIRQQLAQADSANFVAQTDLASILVELANLALAQTDAARAKQLLNDAKKLLESLDQDDLQQSAEARKLMDEIARLLNISPIEEQ